MTEFLLAYGFSVVVGLCIAMYLGLKAGKHNHLKKSIQLPNDTPLGPPIPNRQLRPQVLEDLLEKHNNDRKYRIIFECESCGVHGVVGTDEIPVPAPLMKIASKCMICGSLCKITFPTKE